MRVPTWDSEFVWEPLLEQNCSESFDTACSKYSHYLDTVMDRLKFIKVGADKWEKEEYEKKLFLSTLNLQNQLILLSVAILHWKMISLFQKDGMDTRRMESQVYLTPDCTHIVALVESDFIEKSP